MLSNIIPGILLLSVFLPISVILHSLIILYKTIISTYIQNIKRNKTLVIEKSFWLGQLNIPVDQLTFNKNLIKMRNVEKILANKKCSKLSSEGVYIVLNFTKQSSFILVKHLTFSVMFYLCIDILLHFFPFTR